MQRHHCEIVCDNCTIRSHPRPWSKALEIHVLLEVHGLPTFATCVLGPVLTQSDDSLGKPRNAPSMKAISLTNASEGLIYLLRFCTPMVEPAEAPCSSGTGP